mgnify:CR=1 FL=1
MKPTPIPLALLLAATGCNRSSLPPPDPSDGAMAADLALPPDLATPPDLAPSPLRCTPDCDAGQCNRTCRDSKGGPLPDLVPLAISADWDGLPGGGRVLSLCILNQGEAPVPAGIPVTFYFTYEPNRIATVQTNASIAPGTTTRLQYHWADAPNSEGSCAVWAVVDDDGNRRGFAGECDESNNRSEDADPHLCGPG